MFLFISTYDCTKCTCYPHTESNEKLGEIWPKSLGDCLAAGQYEEVLLDGHLAPRIGHRKPLQAEHDSGEFEFL